MDKKITFGTDGIRGHADRWPFTDDSLYVLGFSLFEWIVRKYGYDDDLSIMIGYDTRESAERIKKALMHGLLHVDNVIIHDVGIIPTPVLLWWAQKKNATVAIMISASHNPYFDNGIKVFDVATGKINQQDEDCITELYNRTYSSVDFITFKQSNIPVLSLNNDWKNCYKKWIQDVFPKNLFCEAKIVIDAANGAMSDIAVDIFKLFVSELVVLNAKPDGKNINVESGALYPERLARTVVEEKAILGFAFDGDGDRVISVDSYGQVRDGDDMLHLLLQHPDYCNQKTVVGTIMSNSGFEQALKLKEIKLIRTAVGDKHVTSAMREHASMIGGEASGHIILKPHTTTGDGLFVAMKVFETIFHKHACFSNSFARSVQIHSSLPITERVPFEDLYCYQELQNLYQKITPGRMIVRYSGTENLVRITTEHENEFIAETINKQAVTLLKNAY